MLRLKCKPQSYAWGKVGSDSLVARLLTSSSDNQQLDLSKPYAELWMGTHPSAPSIVVNNSNNTNQDGSQKPLKDFIPKTETDGDIPYLFKVLSVDKALSIQAHPDKALAAKLHASDPAHYPDPNHKPELVVALTPFKALC
jgi:mannose-6-phosphate isomerase